ncbi:Dyp-type peroxidase [Fomitiporia mediterranea MF3/22]|uniref:Dyp-type peroxidase n=1 Tax=Fomitiporia mediterranea (strain MF3/22) TaxID=694068 RepID=UPI000440810F|nr:Dyp-type peroxidase [Fomitiporia mediterranea MF3/22]EJC98213.1 Dyp-type peroxidase [Fomitiporia mediterranea MF3/22]
MSWPTPADLDDLQGDVVLGLPKRAETFIFFNIANVANFKKSLQQFIPAVTTTTQVQQLRKEIADHKLTGSPDLLQIQCMNFALSRRGMKELGVTDDLRDGPFNDGQKAHAQPLGDNGKQSLLSFDPDWLLPFKNEVDGVFLITGDSDSTVLDGINKVNNTFSGSFTEMLKVEGRVRPGKEKGHEHFGFRDGISFPAIRGFVDPFPGQTQVDPGVIVCKTNGDGVLFRPDWAKNGSFLVYRHLQQFVPEFNTFVENNPVADSQVAAENQVELAGARMFGRWKSGAPTALSPFADDPALADDPQKNNNFNFSEVNLNDQTRCPFAAHVRKSNPRKDLTSVPAFGEAFVESHMISRQSVPYGPEVDPDAEKFTTVNDRGLAFVCYQSNIDNGFEFVQKTWANDVLFPPLKLNGILPLVPGFDPIIGQNNGNDRQMAGLQIDHPAQDTKLPIEFVVSKGGAYFFSPSITALKTKFSV